MSNKEGIKLRIDRKSTAIQLLTSTTTRIIVLGGSFLLSIILARYLGPEKRGIVTAIFIIPNLLISFADLGVKQASAYYLGKKIFDSEKLTQTVLFLWLLSSTISILIAFIYYKLFSVESYGWLLLSIPLFSIPFMLLEKYMDGLLLGSQMVFIINRKQILSFVFNFLFTIIVIYLFGINIYSASLILLVISVITAMYSLNKISKKIKISIKFNSEIFSAILSKGFLYALTLFILSLNYKIDILFMEKMTNPKELGLYTISVSLSELIWQIPTALGMVIFSKSATTHKESDSVQRTIKLLRIVSLPSLLISLILWIASPFLVPLLYGEIYSDSVSMIRFLLPGILAMVIFKVLNADLAGRGYVLFSLKSYFISLLINIILNIILIPKYGGNGAAIASSVSYTIGSCIICKAYIKAFNIKFKDMFMIRKTDLSAFKKLIRR